MKLNLYQRNISVITALVIILLLEALYISQRYDASGLLMFNATSGWRQVFGYFGSIAKVTVLGAFILFLLLKDSLSHYVYSLTQSLDYMRLCKWLLLHLAVFALFLWSTDSIFSHPVNASHLTFGTYFVWGVSGAASVLSWCLALAPWQSWAATLRREYRKVFIACLVALVVWLMASYTKSLWGPMSDLTFLLSALLLSLIDSRVLYIDVDEKLLGMGDFVVNVAPACSGYEGIGLVTAFTALYLYMYKTEFRFPRAIILFPLGAVCIWLLNVVRICVLVVIGHYWSEDVAVGGFHSQAGWLTFIVTSLGLLWLARSSHFFTKQTVPQQVPSNISHASADTAIATLVPMVSLLAVVLLTSAFSAGFDWLYPLRVLVVIVALWFCWSRLHLRPYRLRMEALGAGFIVAVLWVLILGESADADAIFESGLASMPFSMSIVWLLFRFIGSVITVPIAEELAFRAYMLCKLSKVEVDTRGQLPVSIIAIGVSSLAFGVLHGAWVAGTVAGVIYALVRVRSGHIGDAIVAHATTNALLFVFAIATGEWSLL